MTEILAVIREAIRERVAGTAMIQSCYLECACEEIERLQRELAECKAKYEADCKEVTAARLYLREKDRLLKELKCQS